MRLGEAAWARFQKGFMDALEKAVEYLTYLTRAEKLKWEQISATTFRAYIATWSIECTYWPKVELYLKGFNPAEPILYAFIVPDALLEELAAEILRETKTFHGFFRSLLKLVNKESS